MNQSKDEFFTRDPKWKNQLFDSESVGEYLNRYATRLSEVLLDIDASHLKRAFELFTRTVQSKSTVFVAGNGGSAAIASHLCCDWTKGTYHPEHPSVRTHSLSSESSVVTAFANDFGYDKVFSGQLRMLGSTGDLLILISSSGNSQNVLEAAQEAKELRIRTIGFTGFSGGELKSMVDVNLHVPADNYGIVEDSHQALMHVFAQHLDQVRRGP